MLRLPALLLLCSLGAACTSTRPIETAPLTAGDLFGSDQIELTWTHDSQEERWSSRATLADGRLELVLSLIHI